MFLKQIIYSRIPFRDFGLGNMGFSVGGIVYGVEVGGFLCGGVWFFWWFHLVGIGVGFLGELRVEV